MKSQPFTYVSDHQPADLHAQATYGQEKGIESAQLSSRDDFVPDRFWHGHNIAPGSASRSA